MNPAAQLTRLLAEWHRLTQLEGQAILGDDWREAARRQQEKALLCPAINQAIQEVCSIQPGADAITGPFGPAARRLAVLEARNLEVLRAKCHRKRAELEGLGQTSRNLQGVRRAYGGPGSHLWQSYS